MDFEQCGARRGKYYLKLSCMTFSILNNIAIVKVDAQLTRGSRASTVTIPRTTPLPRADVEWMDNSERRRAPTGACADHSTTTKAPGED
ncbi:hypothetical protein KIN20_002731 [Parelaphostrongylus tenuis]|uniref:Uncharacterized protein n=1 Tax=Parelaphostrongylus tenuis TaxID=148309 RepID=A0AAD5LW83_PARTN|nr:hypothetical protein KIN20_002731 [Parelaphostrongylus tenuis]